MPPSSSVPDDEEDFLIEDGDGDVPGDAGSGPVSGAGTQDAPPWCLLVVDDEPGVHAITQLALKTVRFKGRGLEILSAYSGTEALEILRARNDIAVILLDVVMETDDAGLRCARAIREELGNREVRIILRTGQPGQAPERDVILDYDINDYKAKTELTAQKLLTTMVAALRTYDHIMTIETSRRGLDMVIDASASLFLAHSLEQFHSGVLMQLQAMIGVGEDGILCVQRGRPPALSGVGGAAGDDAEPIIVLAASGRYRDVVNSPLDSRIPAETVGQIEACFQDRRSIFGDRLTTLFISTAGGREVVASFDSQKPLSPHDQRMIEVFAAKVSLGFENLHRFNQLRAANAAAAAMIAGFTEERLPGLGRRALRVARLGEAIARHLARNGTHAGGLDGVVLDLLSSVPVIEAGRTALPPAGSGVDGSGVDGSFGGRFTPGEEITAALTEHWDGSGGPLGLSGGNIPLAARILAVADRFDALRTGRDGAPALDHADAVARLTTEAGRHLDPLVVAALRAVADAA